MSLQGMPERVLATAPGRVCLAPIPGRSAALRRWRVVRPTTAVAQAAGVRRSRRGVPEWVPVTVPGKAVLVPRAARRRFGAGGWVGLKRTGARVSGNGWPRQWTPVWRWQRRRVRWCCSRDPTGRSVVLRHCGAARPAENRGASRGERSVAARDARKGGRQRSSGGCSWYRLRSGRSALRRRLGGAARCSVAQAAGKGGPWRGVPEWVPATVPGRACRVSGARWVVGSAWKRRCNGAA